MSGQSGSSSSQSSFNQKIPKFQEDALKQLYGQANTQYGQTAGSIAGRTPGADSFINNVNQGAMGGYNDALQGGVYQNMGNQQALQDSLQQSLANPSATSQIYGQVMGGQGNNYADAMKASYITDANRAQQNMLGNLDARAAASGMSGGSRHGTATAQGMNDINSNLQKNLATTGYETFNQDLQNKLGIAQQADQGTLQRQQMLSDMIGQQQGVQTGALNQGQNMQNLGMGSFAPGMVGWNNMSNYANTIGSPNVLSSGSSSSSSKSGGGGL
jgi:hypothetical protein